MTALYFESKDGTQFDTAIFDGYVVGDRILEGVRFIVKIEDGKLHPTIHPDDAGYFSTLNQKYWMDKVTEYAQDYDVFSHPQNREDVYLVTDETPEPVVGVVGKAYTWEEVLQKAKEPKCGVIEYLKAFNSLFEDN
jgi:hypothetical protein